MNKKVKKAGILLGIYLLICILDLILSQGFVNKVKDNVSFLWKIFVYPYVPPTLT